MNKTDGCVNILIKTSNQAIQDLTVQCELNWTVKQLKSHLALVYPNNPHPEVQKLIYFGRFLPNEAILSEVLKTYDGQQNNTIHLVLCHQYTYVTQEMMNNIQEHNTSNNCQSEEWAGLTVNDNSPPLNADVNTIRDRMPNINLGYPLPYPNEAHNQQYIYQQMVWMQQAYVQYITQYMQFAYNSPQRAAPHERQPTGPQQNAAAPDNRNEEEVEDEGHMNRDWLDWLYIVSRLAVLFSVVYFYSSPMRCIMVTTMALLLYHLGMLRWRPLQNNNNNNNNNNNHRVEPQDGTLDAENTTEEPQSPHPPPQHHYYLNWVSIGWTFVSSFFLSLIPDQREV